MLIFSKLESFGTNPNIGDAVLLRRFYPGGDPKTLIENPVYVLFWSVKIGL
jgi:hypothetical protein